MNNDNTDSNPPEKRKKSKNRWEAEENDDEKEETKRIKQNNVEVRDNGENKMNDRDISKTNLKNAEEQYKILQEENEKKRIRTHNPLLEGCREVYCYTRIKYLGQGTYGSVYLAEDNETKERYALKKVKVDGRLSNEGFPITALRETNILLDLHHQNIINIREMVINPDNGAVYMVMDYMDYDLRYLIENMKYPFSLEEIKTIMFELLSAIEYLHSKWYIHRDLKSSNILYKSGRICIADFGSARKYGDPLKSYTQLVITQYYRPPELLLSGEELENKSNDYEKLKYSTAVDMWSIGCIFGELITSQPLFRGEGEIGQLLKIFKILGSPSKEDLLEMNNKSQYFRDVKIPKYPDQLKQTLQQYGKHNGQVFISNEGYDLLRRLLEYNPNNRISASEALQHPYFIEKPCKLTISQMPNFKLENGKLVRVVSTLKDIYLRK